MAAQKDLVIFDDETPGTPADTPVPTLPPVTEAFNAVVSITSPPAGITADSPVTFFGTATDPHFGRYDLQALRPQIEGEWVSLLDAPGTEPVQDNILGRFNFSNFNFSNWLSGDYVIRILVTNPGGEEVGQCGIQFTVDGI